ncbi:MAG: hypothetical protein COU47_04065 [Candidatus Niyogibacteria bacterium CG10_big_fil_rev_8_21_14_0_10_46_36]|uniref:6-carboxy-5,6,7,8-tetrahydropterin synthase n=1 Tax=Candidatus Niyogibacteria bacterium CG10_big_fil_rev_8_21_14_0_10_46_36 TaxID=1974726 RepID=A0A2H0TCG3_9BACT|nr:MAG: hypothetical protein COU47_04065 [Candidatus Niyogibacteria bacterium CG10_big_fil_rev_8_21_14_0_10_46_36]
MAAIYIEKKMHFEASHSLIDVNNPQNNEPRHSHLYSFTVRIKGGTDKGGMITNIRDVKRVLKKEIVDALNGRYLNDVFPEMNPTMENLAEFIYNSAKLIFPGVVRVQIWENEDSSAIYEEE